MGFVFYIKVIGTQQTKIGFVNKSGGLQGVIAAFLSEVLTSQATQLVVYERHESRCSNGTTVPSGGEHEANALVMDLHIVTLPSEYDQSSRFFT